MEKRIFEKYNKNPIVTPAMMPINVLYVFNPGAIKFNGQYILMMDCTTLDDIHRFWIARSDDGINFTPDPEPVKWPEPDPCFREVYVYEPRITKFGDEYIILYASDLGDSAVRIGIIKTKNFEHFERVSIASELGNRNGCLFPEKIDSLYVRLDRPFDNEINNSSIWLSYSPDLVFWGKSKPLTYKGNMFCDAHKIGGGAVPIKTEQGWLEIYHTVSTTCNGFIYRLKACLLDLKDPSVVLKYTRNFILWPEYDYEMHGRTSNVVFTCNALPEDDGTVRIYYGAADSSIGLATAKLQDIIDACE